MDSITKSVGGKYIEMFSQHIQNVFQTAFKESPNTVRRKLLTLLKTWYIYYPHDILDTIYNELDLAKYEKELLTPEDHAKLKNFFASKSREENKQRPSRQITNQPRMTRMS